jgi:hypothetical protein
MDSANIFTKQGFYLLLAGGAISIVGGLYYLYDSFVNAENKTIKENKPKPSPNSTNSIRNDVAASDVKFTKELGLEIFNKMTYLFEEYIEATDTIHHKTTRMSYMNQPEEYARLCGIIVAQRNKDYQEIKSKVLKDYKVSEQVFQNFLGSISLFECEVSIFASYKPKLSRYPSPDTVKDAFFLFAETMKNAHERYSSVQYPELKNAYLLIEKVRIEDEIYIKYGLRYFLIKYFIHEYNLFEDPKVKDYYYILPLLK